MNVTATAPEKVEGWLIGWRCQYWKYQVSPDWMFPPQVGMPKPAPPESAFERGVRLLGDVPIFVPADSANVRANPSLFRVDRRGGPTLLTGCPPDVFNAEGQVWGQPHYRWSAHRADGLAWWAARIAAHVERFDAVRLDPFCGFVRAWEVSALAPDPKRGRWGRSPGRELLEAIVARIGAPPPLFTEDMGPEERGVEALRKV